MLRKLCSLATVAGCLGTLALAVLMSGPRVLTGASLCDIVGANPDCDTPGTVPTNCGDAMMGSGCLQNYNKCKPAVAGNNGQQCKPGNGTPGCPNRAECQHPNADTTGFNCNKT